MLFKSLKEKNSVFKWGIKVYKKAKDSNRSYYRSFTQGKLNLAIGDFALTIVNVKEGEGATGDRRRKCQVTKIIELFEIEINHRRSRHAVVQWFTRVHDLPAHLQKTMPNTNRSFEIVQDNRPELVSEVSLHKLHANCTVIYMDNSIPGNALMEREMYGNPLFYCSWRFDGQQIESIFKPEPLKKKVTFSEIGIKPKSVKTIEKDIIKPFCRECNSCFSSFNILADHINIEHFPESTSLPCFFCDSEHPSVTKLKIHYRMHSAKPSAMTFPCPTCKKQFKMLSQLKAHSAIHVTPQVKDKIFECTHCDFTGLFKAMKDHILKIHEGQFPYSCTFCSRGFLIPSMFLRHKELCKTRRENKSNESLEQTTILSDEVEPELLMDNDEESNDSMEYEGSTDEEDEGEQQLEKSKDVSLKVPTTKGNQAEETPKEDNKNENPIEEDPFEKLLSESMANISNKPDEDSASKEASLEKAFEEATSEKTLEIALEKLQNEEPISEIIPEKISEEISLEKPMDEKDSALKENEILPETLEEEEPMDTTEPTSEMHLTEEENSAIQEDPSLQTSSELTFTIDESSVALTQALGLTASSENQVHAIMEDGTQVVHIINQDQISDEDIGLNPIPGQQQVLVLDPDSAAALLGQAGKEGNGQTNMVISVEGLYGQQLIAIPQPEGGQQIIQMTEETHELLGKVLENHPQSEAQNTEGQIDMLPPIDFPNLSSAVEDMEVEQCIFQQVEASSHSLLTTPQYTPSTTTETIIMNENEFINKDF